MRLLRTVQAAAILIGVAFGADGARALEAVNVKVDASAIDLTDAVERPKTETDRIQVSTAPGADGIVRRIEVRGPRRPEPSGPCSRSPTTATSRSTA